MNQTLNYCTSPQCCLYKATPFLAPLLCFWNLFINRLLRKNELRRRGIWLGWTTSMVQALWINLTFFFFWGFTVAQILHAGVPAPTPLLFSNGKLLKQSFGLKWLSNKGVANQNLIPVDCNSFIHFGKNLLILISWYTVCFPNIPNTLDSYKWVSMPTHHKNSQGGSNVKDAYSALF